MACFVDLQITLHQFGIKVNTQNILVMDWIGVLLVLIGGIFSVEL